MPENQGCSRGGAGGGQDPDRDPHDRVRDDGVRGGTAGRAAAGAELPPPRSGRACYRPAGLRRVLPLSRSRVISIDFDMRVVSRGGVELSFSTIRHIEVNVGVCGISDGVHWICFDTHGYIDRNGRLSRADGSLSPSFSRDYYDLQRAVADLRGAGAAASAAGSGDPPAEIFEFGSRVRVDFGSILLGLFMVGLFVWYYSGHGGRSVKDLFDTDALWYFSGAIVLGVLCLFVWRGTFRARFDDAGLHVCRAWLRRSYPWSELHGLRQQGLEIELEADRSRVSFNLDILHGAGAPLLVRRGIRPIITPLGGRFLDFVRARTEQRPEVPIFGTRTERLVGRVWILVLVVANAIMFYRSAPPSVLGGNDLEGLIRYQTRLIDLGARTAESFQEPWRFLTALFLHGDIFHVGVNMLVLASIAPWLGRIYGWFRGTLHYLLGGILGNALAQVGWLLSPPESALSVGASTALMGIIGSLLGAVYRRPLSVPLAVRARFRWAIPVMVLLTLGLGFSIPMIDNGAHLGGFAAGVVLAWIIPPRPGPEDAARSVAELVRRGTIQ